MLLLSTQRRSHHPAPALKRSALAEAQQRANQGRAPAPRLEHRGHTGQPRPAYNSREGPGVSLGATSWVPAPLLCGPTHHPSAALHPRACAPAPSAPSVPSSSAALTVLLIHSPFQMPRGKGPGVGVSSCFFLQMRTQVQSPWWLTGSHFRSL